MMSQPKPCQALNPALPNTPSSPGEGPRDDRWAIWDEEVLDRPRRPPAAARRLAPTPTTQAGPQRPGASRSTSVRSLFLLTLLSAVDGSLVALAAAGRLHSIGSAIAIGLTVVAGAGAWLAAHQAFGGRIRTRFDYAILGALGAATLAATAASVWLGTQLGTAVTLHVLPKAAGLVLVLIGLEVAGARLPRAGRVPLPMVALAAGVLLEGAVQWTP